MVLYDEDYFERGVELGISGYSNYRWIPELTIPLCARMVEYLFISDEEKLLDFGCAKGFLVKAFRLLHKQCWGFDISNYAVEKSPSDVREYVSTCINDFSSLYPFDWIIVKDVFEHISYREIDSVLQDLSSITKKLFCVSPLGHGGNYMVPVYEIDKTHIIREGLEWWVAKFEDNGFKVKKAEYNMKYIKQNYEKWEKGNGFFILHSELSDVD